MIADIQQKLSTANLNDELGPNTPQPPKYHVKILYTANRENQCQKFAIFADQLVGNGANSIVRMGVCLDSPDNLLAVKIISLAVEGARERVLRELTAACRLSASCQNIVKIERYRVESRSHVYIFMEHCNGGTLTGKIREQTWSPKEVERLFCELARGYEALHQASILHEDIKPDNILIHNGTYKIADFGLSSLLEVGRQASTKRRGTLKYMAPEKLTRKDYVGDVSSDMYSLGLVLFEAATGKHPYFEQEYMSATQLINMNLPVKHRAALQSNCSGFPKLAQLILRMVCRDLEQRAHWSEVIRLADEMGKVEPSEHILYYKVAQSRFLMEEVQLSQVDIDYLEPISKSESKTETIDTETGLASVSEHPSPELLKAVESILNLHLHTESTLHRKFLNGTHQMTLLLKKGLLKNQPAHNEHLEDLYQLNHAKHHNIRRVLTELARSDLTHRQIEAIYTHNITQLIETEMAIILGHHEDPRVTKEVLSYTYHLVYLLSIISALPQNVQPPERMVDGQQMIEVIEEFLNGERQLCFMESLEAEDTGEKY